MVQLLSLSRRLTRCVVMVWLLIAVPLNARADEDSDTPKVRGKVIGRIWHTQVNGGQFFSYTRKLAEELELPSSPIMMMLGGGGAMGAGLMNSMGQPSNEEKGQSKGTLLFLESSPEAGTPRFVSFQSVKDQASYQKIVKKQSGAMFGGAEVIGDNDRHEVRLNLNRLVNMAAGPTEGADEEEGVERKSMSFSISIGASPSSGGEPSALPESVDMPSSISTYYRYHDGFMYSGQLEAIHTMDLPAGKTLQQKDDEAALDLRAEIDLREVPRLLKQQLWTGLQTRAMTYLQRFDEEKAEDHAVRSALGKGRLELLKAAMFDVDEVSLAVQFSKEATQPVAVKLNVKARKESQLASALAAISQSRSSLTSLRDQDSPLMLSSTVDLPDWIKPLAVTFAKSLQAKMKESAGDESTSELLDQMFLPIADTLESGQLDAVFTMDGEAATGATVVGGMKMVDSENFQTALETLLVIQPESAGYRLTQSKAGQQSVLTLSTTAEFSEGSSAIPVTIHLAGSEGYLWFAIGGDSALEVLKQHLEKSKSFVKSSGVARPLEIRLKLSQWLGSEVPGFSKLPAELLEQTERLVSSMADRGQSMSFSVNGKTQKVNNKNEFKSYASKVLGQEGADFQLKLQATGRQLDVDAEIGSQVVKFLVAQYVVAQNRMFQNIKFELPDMSGLEGVEGGSTRIQTIRIGK